jgi:hypothetical protein
MSNLSTHNRDNSKSQDKYIMNNKYQVINSVIHLEHFLLRQYHGLGKSKGIFLSHS